MEITWKEAAGGNIPLDATIAGHEADGTSLYCCRAKYQNGLHPGKVRPEFGAANIPYGGAEVKVNPYEVYCGGGKWVDASNGNIPEGAICLGNEKDGTPIFVARAAYNGGIHPGKIRHGFGAANIPYGNKEVKVANYQVLVEK
jgi:hypothetical protein